ncbi:MAG: universal stress protein [Candidatus Marinimicrobia bacterium]|nr:universal stress protein [Candidatus Neomarinimicrobiota bacterium]|tara:strand:- start:10 stop:894 length:885 start_codon:yes stop_codon:yes gene_type:complete
MKILIAIGSKNFSKPTLRLGMKVAQAFKAKTTIIDVGEKISEFSSHLVELAQDQMESWDFDPPGVDVLEWAFNYLSDNKLIDSKQIETGFPKNRLIDDGEDRKLVYLSGTVCDDVNLILRNGDIISELREEVQFGKYDVTIIGRSRKRNMSHDLLQYINSSVLIVNNYQNEKFDKILLPLNDSSGMMKVAKYAIRVALALKVSIEILTVTNKKDSDVVNRSKIDKLIKLIRRSGVAHFHKIEEGDIVEKIVKRAGKDKIIVMKASSMSPIQRFFKGSIPLSVMNECDVPILIVK